MAVLEDELDCACDDPFGLNLAVVVLLVDPNLLKCPVFVFAESRQLTVRGMSQVLVQVLFAKVRAVWPDRRIDEGWSPRVTASASRGRVLAVCNRNDNDNEEQNDKCSDAASSDVLLCQVLVIILIEMRVLIPLVDSASLHVVRATS